MRLVDADDCESWRLGTVRPVSFHLSLATAGSHRRRDHAALRGWGEWLRWSAPTSSCHAGRAAAATAARASGWRTTICRSRLSVTLAVRHPR